MTALHMPPQDNLGAALAILRCQISEHRLLQQALVAVAQRIPRHEPHIVLLQELFQLCLREVGVGLHLHHLGLEFHSVDGLPQKLLREVGQANCLDLAFPHRFFDCSIASSPVVGGLMEEQQVDIVGTQAGQGFVHCCLLFVDCRPELGHQENVLPGDAALFDSAPGGALIHIAVGGINEAHTAVQRAFHRRFCLVRCQHKHTNPSHGHFHAIVQCYKFHIVLLLENV